MKIDPIANIDYVKSTYAPAAKVSGADTRVNNSDEVTFSAEARTFSMALSAAKAGAIESDSAKVAEVKAQVEAGTYFVSADKIAESIIMRSAQ